MTKPIQKQKTFTRNNFAEHNYNYVNRLQTSEPIRPNTQNHIFSQRHNFQQTTTTSVNFHEYPRISQDQSENYPFFQQKKTINKTKVNIKHLNLHLIIYHQRMMTTINQIFFHHIHKNTVYNHLDQINHPKIQICTHKTQLIHYTQTQNATCTQPYQTIQIQNPASTHSYQPTQMQNEIPLPYFLQQHEITKNQLTNFSQTPNAAESLQMTMNPYLMGRSSKQSNTALMVFTVTDSEYSVEDYLNAVTANLILN